MRRSQGVCFQLNMDQSWKWARDLFVGEASITYPQ